MSLSDYLTGDEWDACYYASLGKHHSSNFGESMHKTIDALLAVGHKFPGLDKDGNKKEQVSNVNANKTLIFFGDPTVDALNILDNGRNFLKKKLPHLVDETDDEWHEELKSAKEHQDKQKKRVR